jgi:hypothetical protein
MFPLNEVCGEELEESDPKDNLSLDRGKGEMTLLSPAEAIEGTRGESIFPELSFFDSGEDVKDELYLIATATTATITIAIMNLIRSASSKKPSRLSTDELSGATSLSTHSEMGLGKWGGLGLVTESPSILILSSNFFQHYTRID